MMSIIVVGIPTTRIPVIRALQIQALPKFIISLVLSDTSRLKTLAQTGVEKGNRNGNGNVKDLQIGI